MQWAVELTNFNIRCGPTTAEDGEFEVAVNCVVADHETVIVKGLCAEEKISWRHISAIRRAIYGLGFKSYDWKSKRKEIGMPLIKTKLPHPSSASSDAEHIANIKTVLEQMGFKVEKVEEGHYGVKDISVSQTDLGNGEVSLSISMKRFELDPSAAAA